MHHSARMAVMGAGLLTEPLDQFAPTHADDL